MKDERFRIAQLVRGQLLSAQERQLGDQIDQAGALFSQLERYQGLHRKATRAYQSRYLLAAQRVNRQMERLLADMTYHVETASRALSKKLEPIPGLHDLIRELDQIHDEFGAWSFDVGDQMLSVTTDAIELEGLYFGRFEIRLHLQNLVNPRGSHPFQCVALDPNPAASADHVTHPHVSDNSLCAGDATATLMAALESGRLCDFFLIVKRVLHTYNAESPYVALDQWDGESCPDCNYVMGDEDRYFCEDCEQNYCSECISGCHGCDVTVCRSCLQPCSICDESVCRECLTSCEKCGDPCCESCLDNGLCLTCKESQEENHEEAQESETQIVSEAAPEAA